jgi:predicted transcriptional regulator
MEAIELKFLLKLLGKPYYRSPIREISPSAKTSASQRDRICRRLRDRGLVEVSEEVTKFKLDPAGKALLTIDPANSPLSSQERQILHACEKRATVPAKTGVPVKERTALIQSLLERELIQATQTRIRDVWLTEEGKRYLLEEYEAMGEGTLTLPKGMLTDYLRFLRQHAAFPQPVVSPVPPQEIVYKPSDEEVLQAIVELNRKLDGDGEVPIFRLRRVLEPPLSREELDRALVRLEKDEKIELTAIVNAMRYSREEFDAGIPQRAGSRLFFIKVRGKWQG